MKNTNIFKRHEVKYLITKEEKEALYDVMKDYMEPDAFGNSTIRNIYYDTPDKYLIRRSIEKPDYKEKLRVRSYKQARKNSQVFIEIKKKYKGIVYKRRMALGEETAKNYLRGNLSLLDESQISKEINYLMDHYGDVEPAIFLAYDREAFFRKTDPNFRMTFDENVIIRDYDMSLSSPVYGEEDMIKGKVILEVKTVLGMPQWLLDFFSEREIYKASFSKYGNAYLKHLLPKYLEEKEAAALREKSEKENVKKLEEIRERKPTDNLKRSKDRKNKRNLATLISGIREKKARSFIPYLSVVVLFLVTLLNWQFQNVAAYSQVYFDVNPGIHFTTNRKEEVIKLEAENLEGQEIISGINYKGKTVDDLTKEILDKMEEDEYLSIDREYFLLSVDHRDEKKIDKKRDHIDILIHSHLNESQIQPVVLKQDIDKSEEIEELAKKHKVSISKMTFIRNIVRLNENLNEEELVELSIAQLVELTREQDIDIGKIVNTADMEKREENIQLVINGDDRETISKEDFIQELIALDDRLKKEELAKLSTEGLVKLAQDKNLNLEGILKGPAEESLEKAQNAEKIEGLEGDNGLEKTKVEKSKSESLPTDRVKSQDIKEAPRVQPAKNYASSNPKPVDYDDDDDDYDDDDDDDYDDDDDDKDEDDDDD